MQQFLECDIRRIGNIDEDLPDVERGMGRDGLETHTIQILDEPCQILALQVLSSTSKLATAKAAAELLVKLWRSHVEVAQLL